MIKKILDSLSGYKTYICIIAWGVYQIALGHSWILPNPDIESLILVGAGMSVRDALTKIGK
jgi:hypothetical protein